MTPDKQTVIERTHPENVSIKRGFVNRLKYEVIKSISGTVWYVYLVGTQQQVAAVTLNMFKDAEKCEEMANRIASALNDLVTA